MVTAAQQKVADARQNAINYIQSSAGVQAAQSKGMTWSIGQSFSNAWLNYNWLGATAWLKASWPAVAKSSWGTSWLVSYWWASSVTNIPWSNVGTSLNLYNQTNWGTKKKYNPDWSPIEDNKIDTQQDIFWDVMYWDKVKRTPYTGEWYMKSTWEVSKNWAKIAIPKNLNVYWEAAKIAEAWQKWIISARNDYIMSNLLAWWAKTKDDIRNFLNAQQWFVWANSIDKGNTVEAIAARMWITKESITPQDMIAQQQNDLLANYQDEQWQLILDADQQKAWKEFDAIGWTDPSKYPTPEEINSIATKYWLDPKKAQEAADAWKIAKDKSIEQQTWKQKDLWTDKDRNIIDANTQLDRDRETVNNKIDDVVTQLGRDVAWAEKVWALKWYNASSGYIDWINNVKSDANKAIDRLKKALNNAEADTSKYVTRISQDYTTNMDRLKTSMTDQLMTNKMAWTAEVQALLTKYSPTDVLLTKELKRVNDEFGIKSQALMKSFLENFKGITDATMYESEKLQEFEYKQAQLADLTIQNLMANDWMALRSMSDSAIEDLYKAWYIRKWDVSMLLNAKKWANQLYNDYLKEKWLNETTNTLNKTVDRSKTIATYKEIINSWVSYEDWVAQIPDWTPWWQCWYFSNNIAQAMWLPKLFGDSLDSKKAQINSNVPVVWWFAVMNSKAAPENWHVWFVIWINKDWTIKVKSSNYGWDEAVRTDDVSPSSIIWYVNINGKLNTMMDKEDSWPETDTTSSEPTAVEKAYYTSWKIKKKAWDIWLTEDRYNQVDEWFKNNVWQSLEMTDDQRQLRNSAKGSWAWNQTVKDFEQVYWQLKNSTASLTDKSWPWDIAWVYQFMKVLDPSSVVRETEFQIAAKSAWVLPYIGNTFARLEKWEVLTDTQRKAFSKLMKEYTKNKAEMYNVKYNDMTRALKAAKVPEEYRPTNIAQTEWYLESVWADSNTTNENWEWNVNNTRYSQYSRTK